MNRVLRAGKYMEGALLVGRKQGQLAVACGGRGEPYPPHHPPCPHPTHLPLAPQEEQAALEAANVFAILQNTGAVDGVMLQLKRTQGILDDLDESLKVRRGGRAVVGRGARARGRGVRGYAHVETVPRGSLGCDFV